MFKSLVDSSFIRQDDGTVLFFPWGRIGGGYRLTPGVEEQVRRFLGMWYAVSFVVIAVSFLLVNIGALFSLLVLVPWYYFTIRSLLADQRQTSIVQDEAEGPDGMTKPAAAFFVILAIALVATSGWLLFTATEPEPQLAGAFGVLFFGFCLVRLGVTIRRKFFGNQ